MTDREWRESGERRGWSLPAPASRLRRLPIVRHVRWVRAKVNVAVWYGIGPGGLGFPTGHDDRVLRAIRRGWC